MQPNLPVAGHGAPAATGALAPADPRPVTLALQGGGSMGAFAWGVLDRLLDAPELRIEVVSGASAGAMNAAMLVQGLATAAPPGASTAMPGASATTPGAIMPGGNATAAGAAAPRPGAVTPDARAGSSAATTTPPAGGGTSMTPGTTPGSSAPAPAQRR